MESRRWYLLFIPLFAVVGFVVIYPLIFSAYISFANLNGAPSLANYVTMVSTSTFWNALNISLLYSLTSTIVAVAIGLGLTFILTQELRGKGVFEVAYILPLAVAPIVVGCFSRRPPFGTTYGSSCIFSSGNPTSTNSLRPSTFP